MKSYTCHCSASWRHRSQFCGSRACTGGGCHKRFKTGRKKRTLENYVKRLEKLENLANSFAGVEQSYAIQAGREIRVIVQPDKVDDAQTLFLAKEIAKKLDSELEYPGQIKVNVIRELRSVEYAK